MKLPWFALALTLVPAVVLAQTPAAVWIWNGTLSAPVGTGTTSGGLTAVPMPVTIPAGFPITVIPPVINYAAPTAGTVSTTATIVPTPGAKTTTVVNVTASGGGTLWLNPNGGAAVSGQGIPVASGNVIATFGTSLTNPISAVCSTGTCSYTVTLGN